MSGAGMFEVPVSKQVIERVQFSVSSRNAEAKVCECTVHVFGSKFVEDPKAIEWQHITTGVICLVRNKEYVTSKKKCLWLLNLSIYDITYGVLVWKGQVGFDASYTAVADNFHVFALSNMGGIVGLMFAERGQAAEMNKTYMGWHEERMKSERVKEGAASSPHGPTFRKEMISKPCNFQHIQGAQAIEECIEIERIKAEVSTAFAGMAFKKSDALSGAEQNGGNRTPKKRKEIVKTKLEFEKVELPRASKSPEPAATAPSVPTPVESGMVMTQPVTETMPTTDYPFQPPNGYTPAIPISSTTIQQQQQQQHDTYQTNYEAPSLGRLSPLNLEEELLTQAHMFAPSAVPEA